MRAGSRSSRSSPTARARRCVGACVIVSNAMRLSRWDVYIGCDPCDNATMLVTCPCRMSGQAHGSGPSAAMAGMSGL